MNEVDLLALCRIAGVDWSFVARAAQRGDDLLSSPSTEAGGDARRTLELIEGASGSLDERRAWVRQALEAARAGGIKLTTVLSDDYPLNLRFITNLPPFLFYRGHLKLDDAYSVAVVGTRKPSEEGLLRARRMARQLVGRNVTVLSGLARGIDTAAHTEALEAGGRTIAVLGSGLNRLYPPENAKLAEEICETGALVSQFWPDTPPISYNFPRRNVVMSGLGQGTVVIEASSTSGAKMQARFAIEHGKQVFLVKSLVTGQAWARRYLTRPGVTEVEDVADIVRRLRTPSQQRERASERLQMPLAL